MGTSPFFIILFGPTGVGKTACSLALGQAQSIEIINGDMGQVYERLSIGTAKPDWKNDPIAHHLFDIVKDPVHYSAYQYRRDCLPLLAMIGGRGGSSAHTPVIVGGTGFYLKSLFFPPADRGAQPVAAPMRDIYWDLLHAVDPVRAREIHPHDTYRIGRALHIWREHGILPSQLKPSFALPGRCHILFLDRDTDDLYGRIDDRVEEMMSLGWIDEVAALPTSWHTFLSAKGLLGYRDVIEFVRGGCSERELHERIKRQTRAYARRQRIFWRGFKKALPVIPGITIAEINLTHTPFEAYINKIENVKEGLHE